MNSGSIQSFSDAGQEILREDDPVDVQSDLDDCVLPSLRLRCRNAHEA